MISSAFEEYPSGQKGDLKSIEADVDLVDLPCVDSNSKGYQEGKDPVEKEEVEEGTIQQ